MYDTYDPFKFMLVILFIFVVLIFFIFMLIYNNTHGTSSELANALAPAIPSTTNMNCYNNNCIPSPTPIIGQSS
jgi:hypothetical protein